jgi:multiple sugar transport system permease protein
MSEAEGDLLHIVEPGDLPAARVRLGRWLLRGAAACFGLVVVLRAGQDWAGWNIGFESWRAVLYAALVLAIAFGFAEVLVRGEQGKRTLFILPAAAFTVSMVVFPMVFGITIGLSDWNLASLDGRKFNGLDNIRQMLGDPFYLNALKNTIWYVFSVFAAYVIAFGLALLLNAEIRARKFWRVTFLLPLMLSPVAVSWMIGKSLMEYRFGPLASFARWIGWETPAFFTTPAIARTSIMVMDAWTFIPFIMIMLLAGLQAMPKEVMEAARVDGATGWQGFWKITFPLMLPVSLTAIVLRIIFKLKLADLVINVTSGGPGGATDTVSSFIYREYRDRSNVGYGTLLAFVYLILIVVFVTLLLNLVSRYMRRMT